MRALSMAIKASASKGRTPDIPIASVREAESERYELGLAVILPTGGRIMLMELKQAAHSPPNSDIF